MYKSSLLILFVFLSSIDSFSQSWYTEFQNAVNIYQKQDFAGAVEAYYKVKELAISKDETDNELYFDLLKGMTGPMAYLGMASEQGRIIHETILYAKKKYGINSTQYAECLDMKANWHVQYTQDYPEAVKLFTEAYHIKRNFYPEGQRNPLSISLWYLSWYNALIAKDNPDLEDLSFIEKNVQYSRQLDGEQSAMFAATLANTAQSYSFTEDYKKALSYQTKAIQITESLDYYNGKEELLAQMKIDLGIFQYKFYLKINEKDLLAQAQKNINAGIAGFEKLGTWRTNLPRYYKDLGLVFLKLNQIDNAKDCFKKALVIQYEFFDKENYENSFLLREMGQGCLDAGLLKEAINYLSAAGDILLKVIRNNFKYLSEQEKEEVYFNSIVPTLETFNTLALLCTNDFPEIIGQLYNYRLATKGIILNNQEKIHELVNESKEQNIKELYNNWIVRKSLYSSKLNNTSVTTQSLDEIKDDIDRLERTLSDKLHPLTFNSYNNYTWIDIKNKLSPTEAAIEIIRFRKYNNMFTDEIHYAALIVFKNSTKPIIVFVNNGNELEDVYLERYRISMQNYKTTKYDNNLYEQYWQPIAQQIKDKEKIYISKDGVYNLLNLNTLFNPSTGEFLLNEKNLVTLSRTDDLIFEKQKKQVKNAFLFGRPTYVLNNINSSTKKKSDWYSRKKRSVNPGNITWEDLPGTEDEVNTINDLLVSKNINSTIYLKEEATEENLRKLNSPQILHIATHGFFAGELLDNTIKVEEGEVSFRGRRKNAIVSKQNAMQNSGIIFAGVNSFASGEELNDDGVLTAYEATTLNLNNTELVVLSACESGLGSLKSGEGVYGLQRALKIAGANTLLISLWSVDDIATSSFMKTFYKTWLNSGDKLMAYSNAQKQLLATHKHPYYWGAFELIGY